MAGLTDSYLNIITSEHRDKPKYIAMVTALLQPLDDIFAIGITIDDEFDVDLAVGAQEDTLGEIVKMRRTLPFQPTTIPSPVADNEIYRMLIKSQIAKNYWKGGIEDIEEAWLDIFGKRIVIQDNQDMTITVNMNLYSGIFWEILLYGMIVPKPQSVLIKFQTEYRVDSVTFIGAAVVDEIDMMILSSFTESLHFDTDAFIYG